MTWWRRDPSLWCRSSWHHYTRRVLRDNEALLRCRSFSKSQPSSAQHKEEEDSKRPAGISNLEWIQLQHYRRWKRRLEENPYRALFGASNDMLNGKGLKDWQWVYKAFPKWMLKEMEFPEYDETAKQDETKMDRRNTLSKETFDSSRSPSSTTEKYPRKVDITDEDRRTIRESTFREPSFRSSRFERVEYSSGVVSPSDPRRPSEQVMPEQLSKIENQDSTQSANTPDQLAAVYYESQNSPPLGSSGRPAESGGQEHGDKGSLQTRSQEATSRESTFIKEFLIDPSTPVQHNENRSNDWRQTALQRRSNAPLTSMTAANTNSAPPMVPSTTSLDPDRHVSVPYIPFPSPIPSQSTSGRNETPTSNTQMAHVSDLTQDCSRSERQSSNVNLEFPQAITHQHETILANQLSHSLSRPTSDILRKLPEDDIDFLTAEDVRASMGVRKSAQESSENKQKTRSELEKKFEETQKSDLNLDPILGSTVVNNQFIRRTVRDMEKNHEVKRTVPEFFKETYQQSPSSEQNIETSLDRMSRWVQAASKQFWAEPTQTKTMGLLPPHQYKSITSALQASRKAMTQVEEDLENDLPSSKPLLERLKANEISVSDSVERLARSKPDHSAPTPRIRATERILKIRDDLRKTEDGYHEACKALDQKKSNARFISERMKERLQHGSVVLQKNLKLTERIILRVQALEEKPDAPQFSLLLSHLQSRLCALQDTQLAISRLLERALQVFGEPKMRLPEDSIICIPGLSNTFEPRTVATAESTSSSTRDLVAESKLQEEIQAQKMSMQGLSDDGYTRSFKPPKKSTLDEPNPLVHSLFRPFQLQLESLSKETETVEKPTPQSLKNEALVKEIRKSYEDVYGPITADHRQVKVNERDDDMTSKSSLTSIAPISNLSLAGGIEEEKSHQVQTSLKSSDQNDLNPDSTPRTIATEPDQSDSCEPLDDSPKAIEMPTETSSLESPSTDHSITSNQTQQQPPEPTNAHVLTQPLTEPSKPAQMPTKETSELLEPAPPTEPASAEETSSLPEADTPFERTFQILAYDPRTDEIHITTTISKSTLTSASAIPLPEALSMLDSPAKFIQHIDSGFEIVMSKPNLLVLRESSTTGDCIVSSKILGETEPRDEEWKHINPVDGTTRLSPTGFVGVEPDLRDELRTEHAAASRKFYEDLEVAKETEKIQMKQEKRGKKGSRGGAVAGVFKTAIAGGVVCYIAGVIGELLK